MIACKLKLTHRQKLHVLKMTLRRSFNMLLTKKPKKKKKKLGSKMSLYISNKAGCSKSNDLETQSGPICC